MRKKRSTTKGGRQRGRLRARGPRPRAVPAQGIPRGPLRGGTGPGPQRGAASEEREGLKSPLWDQLGRESQQLEAFHGRADQICAQKALGTLPSGPLTKVKRMCGKNGPPQGPASRVRHVLCSRLRGVYRAAHGPSGETRLAQAAPEKCWIKDRNWPHQGTESLGEGWQGCQGRPMGKGNLSWTRKIQMG